jgi:hypothetical protein
LVRPYGLILTFDRSKANRTIFSCCGAMRLTPDRFVKIAKLTGKHCMGCTGRRADRPGKLWVLNKTPSPALIGGRFLTPYSDMSVLRRNPRQEVKDHLT